MARFFGKIGYSLGSVDMGDGVWANEVVERDHFGDVIRNSRQLQTEEQVNPDITVGNSISIVADAYAQENFFAMRYIRWMGALWTVKSVEVERPRLILRLGGVYNGPTPAAEPAP